MPYYKDPENKLHYLDSEEFEYLLPEGSVSISDEEADAMQHPVLPPVIPQVVTPFQAKAALMQSGHLAEVESLMAAEGADPLIKLAWETAQEFKRTSPAVLGIATFLGWTDTELDDLFREAAQIEV